jgi:hypothetical protein
MKDGIGYVALTSPESALSTVEVLRTMRCALISQEEWYVPVSLLGIIGLKLMFFFFRCRLQWEHPGDDGHLGSVSCGVGLGSLLPRHVLYWYYTMALK